MKHLTQLISNSIAAFLLVSTILILAGCGQKGSGTQSLGDSSGSDASFKPESSKPICNPIGVSPSNSRNLGLRGSLFTLKPGAGSFDKFSDVVGPNSEPTSRSDKRDSPVFFGDLNIRPRHYAPEQIAEASNESPLMNPLDELVKSNYMIELTSNLTLKEPIAPADEGDYELAALVQGAVQLELQQPNGQYVLALGNEGKHPVQMVCSKQRIHLKKEGLQPFRLRYLVGNEDIAGLILMWRKVPEKSAPGSDELCNQEGLFFTIPSGKEIAKPAKGFDLLMLRYPEKWKILESGNFALPSGVENLCVAPPKST